MTLTTHAATGLLVTQWTNSPLAGFVVAALSHYLTDAIPHADEWIYWRHVHNRKDIIALIIASADLLILMLLVLAVLTFRTDLSATLIGVAVIGGILPDVLITLHTRSRPHFRDIYHGTAQQLQAFYHEILKAHYAFHMAFHALVKVPVRYRNATLLQVIFIVWFVFYYIFR